LINLIRAHSGTWFDATVQVVGRCRLLLFSRNRNVHRNRKLVSWNSSAPGKLLCRNSSSFGHAMLHTQSFNVVFI